MQKKILFLTFLFPPELSAGATRSFGLVKELAKINKDKKIYIFCPTPNRYGILNTVKESYSTDSSLSCFKNIVLKRFYVPYLGLGASGQSISYLFYFLQVIFAGLIIQPNIIVATSAKLTTGFTGALLSFLIRKKLYLDLRDTFTDNFFYFYRWKKRIIFTSILLLIENFTIKQANSINLVSKGFNSAFYSWGSIINKKNISLTYFSNGISKNFKDKIQANITVSKEKPNKYKIIYCGNLGMGQNIYKLVKNIYSHKNLLTYLKKSKISLEIYGSGIEKKQIKLLIDKNNTLKPESKTIIEYKGLIPKEEVHKVYKDCNFLLVQLAEYNSLSMVIPSKIFEYAATPYPIIFYANGFCFEFISKINGTIPYEVSKPESFINALEKAKQTKVDFDERKRFLREFDSDSILNNYAQHISKI